MVVRKWKLVIGLVLVVVLAAASGISCPGNGDGEEPEFDVLITATAFVPSEITASVGSTITWYNQDTQIHTVTAVNATFDSGNLAPGATFSYMFEEPGTYSYFCTLHREMTGTVTVEEEEPEFDVDIEGYAFQPVEITISVGSTVTWYNKDADIHTVTAVDQTFNSGNMALGDTFSYTFEEPGTFDYYCIPHPYMTGKVIVE